MTDVQVKIELGHRASPRQKPTKEGFTHDWTVYVRGPEQYNIANFVEKVVFHLHATFDNPKRVCKEAPYHVSEHGYAGFELPIDIYFKNKAEPRKIRFKYNLFLHMTEPVNHSRCEKLTFQNPTEEFKKKLLKAGGVLMRPPEETQFTNLFGPPIKTTESPKKSKAPSIASKEKPSRLSLDDSSMSQSSRSKDKESSFSKSTSSSKLDSIRDDSHSSKEKSSKDKHSLSRKHSDSPVTFSSSKRHSESPNRHDHSSKKLKRSSSSSSFPDKKSKEKDKDAERDREREREKEREREREKEREKEKEREREREREKERERERERERDREKERERQKELEREKERLKEVERERERQKELERQKEIEKEKQREAERERQKEIEREKEREREKEKERLKELEKAKQRQREKEKQKRKEKEKSAGSSHPEKFALKKLTSSEKQKLKEKETSENNSVKDSQKKRSPSVDSELRKRGESDRDKLKNIIASKVDSPAYTSNSRKDGHKKHEKSLPIPEKSPRKEKSSKDSKTEKTDRHSLKVEKNREKYESKNIQHKRKSSDSQKSKPKKSVDGSGSHKHKQLSKITSRELIDDLSLSDSSDSSSVSSLSSSTSAVSGNSSDSDNDSEAESVASASRKSSTSSSKSAESTPAQKSALGTLIAEAELDGDESEDDIAEPGSVFSTHSAGSRPSPNRPSTETKPVFSNHSGSSKSSPSRQDSKSVFSITSSKSSPSHHQVDSKLLKKERNKDHNKEDSGKHSRKKSKISGQERNTKPASNSLNKETEAGRLVHSESKGFDVNNKGGEISPISDKSNFNIGDEAPVEMLESPNGEDLTELVALQRKLMSIKDPNILVQVVMLIQKVGKFQIGDSTFDFDLCSLDSGTVQEIRTYLNQT